MEKSPQAFEIARNGDGNCAFRKDIGQFTEVRVGAYVVEKQQMQIVFTSRLKTLDPSFSRTNAPFAGASRAGLRAQ